jgi:hypothetical protein
VNRERFEDLAWAYGGELARWPDALREDAALLAAADPAFATDVLARAADLDATLDALPRATASSRLYDAVLATAPARRPRRSWRFWLGPAGLGAALAGAAAAGVILGAQVGGFASTRTEVSAESVADLDVSTVSEFG